MHRVFIHLGLAATCGCLTTGCAGVNPTPDYARAARRIARATGYQHVFRPDEEQRLDDWIASLAADGLTSDDAAQIALMNNPQLQGAFYKIGMARADLVQSGLLSNPSLGIALRLPSGGGLANIDADLAQNIADLWRIPVRTRAAARNLDRTILEIARQAAEVAMQAKSAYFTAVGADRRLDIARENLEISRKVLELTEIRRQAGAGSELDVNLARGVVLEAELAVQEARLSAASARRSLAIVLGLPTHADASLLVEPLPEPPAQGLDDETILEVALAERLDLRALREAIHTAEERLLLEYRRVFSSVSIGVALERDSRGRSKDLDLPADTARASIAAGRLTAPEFEPRSARDQGTDLIIGPLLSMELPIFDQNQAQIARARFELERNLRRLDGLERSVHQEVREVLDRARTAWKVAGFYRDQVVPQAGTNLEMSRESYRAGKSSVLAVLDAERTYLSARDRYIAALEAAARAIPELERTIGIPWSRIVQATGEATPSRVQSTTQPVEPEGYHGARREGVEP